MKTFHVYILASGKNGTLYVGMTSDLLKRVHEHKVGAVDAFTKKYGIHDLAYFEETSDATVATERERQLKKWNRAWKIELIEKGNPGWSDLYPTLAG